VGKTSSTSVSLRHLGWSGGHEAVFGNLRSPCRRMRPTDEEFKAQDARLRLAKLMLAERFKSLGKFVRMAKSTMSIHDNFAQHAFTLLHAHGTYQHEQATS
jgi:hypothetical protein